MSKQKDHPPPKRRAQWLALVLALTLPGWLIYEHQCGVTGQVEIAQEWACMADLPESTRSLDSTTTGNMFTREFEVSFVADREDIEAWLVLSAGTRGVTPTVEQGWRIYRIDPCGGAQFAEVRVHLSSGRVLLHAFWS